VFALAHKNAIFVNSRRFWIINLGFNIWCNALEISVHLEIVAMNVKTRDFTLEDAIQMFVFMSNRKMPEATFW